MKARILTGGWTWKGALQREGAVVEASAAQVKAWTAAGVAEPVVEEKKIKPAEEAQRTEEVETTEAAAPPENAAKRTRKPRRKKGK